MSERAHAMAIESLDTLHSAAVLQRLPLSRQGSTSIRRIASIAEARGEGGFAPPIVQEVLRSPGQPLDTTLRQFMEPRFGYDFSQVRVHTDARAAQSAQEVKSLAYTVGTKVVFGSGQYAPETSAGKRLIAHELVHVVQQGNRHSGLQGKIEIGQPADIYEQEADVISENIIGEETNHEAVSSGLRIPNAVATGQTTVAKLQRWAYGKGTAPHTDYVEVPKDDIPRIEDAMAIVSKVVNHPKDFPACPKFYKDNCPGGTDTTLINIYNNALVWKDTDTDPKLLGSSVDPNHIAYTKKTYGVGRWAIAASMFHELIHNCGQASHDVGDDAKAACGKLPNI